MADKAISELISAEQITAEDMFVLEQNGTAKKLTGQVLLNWLTKAADGHGGIKNIEPLSSSGLADTYRITLADTTVFDYVVTNGRGVTSILKTQTTGLVDTYTISYNDGTSGTFTVTNGAKGDKGDAAYIWVKYAAQEPTADSHSFGDVPDSWIGLYFGTASEAPEDWQQYTWYQWKGDKGDPGTPAVLTGSAVEYQVGDTGTVIPSGSWSTAVPNVPQGKYLWTRTTNRWNTGDPVTAYSVSRMGLDGAGSVSSVANISPDATGNVPLTAQLLGALSSAGGTMTGPINMNGQAITGLNDPVSADQPISKGYADQNYTGIQVLWENASPTSDFSAQQITINDMTSYSLFIVEFRFSASSSRKIFSIVRKGYETPCCFPGNLTSGEYRILFATRTVTVSTSGYISFSACYSRNEDTEAVERTDRVIPVRIYGFEGVIS